MSPRAVLCALSPVLLRALLLLLLCASQLASAASFDCHAPQRPMEKAICSTPKLNRADETMGRLYRDALGKLSSVAVGQVRADQVQWLAWVQAVCSDRRAAPAAMATCLQPLYDSRLRGLRMAAVRRGSVTFYTRSQYLAVHDDRPEWQNYGEYPAWGTLEATWPAADSTDAQWRQWNRAIEIRTLLMAGTGEEDATQQMPPGPPAWSDSLARRRNTEVTGLLRFVEHGRVTATLTSESMGRPAAHPGESFETVTWLLATQHPLQVEDVFTAGSPWQHLLSAACYHDLSTGDRKQWLFSSITGPDAKPLREVVADTHHWTLEPDGLHITYPEYAVAPRVAQPDDTVVPWATLQSVLAAGFEKP